MYSLYKMHKWRSCLSVLKLHFRNEMIDFDIFCNGGEKSCRMYSIRFPCISPTYYSKSSFSRHAWEMGCADRSILPLERTVTYDTQF
jgi:hypothetical protein